MPDDDRYPLTPTDLHGRISRHAHPCLSPGLARPQLCTDLDKGRAEDPIASRLPAGRVQRRQETQDDFIAPLFQVVELWVFGDLLDVPKDVDVIEVALVTDLPVDEVPWITEPVGAEHRANSTRLSRNPF